MLFLSFEFSYEFNYDIGAVIRKENESSKASKAEKGSSMFYREIFGENRGSKGGAVHCGVLRHFEKYRRQSANSRYIK